MRPKGVLAAEAIVIRLKSDRSLTAAQRQAAFKKQTGKSKQTYYNYMKMVKAGIPKKAPVAAALKGTKA